MYFKSIGALDQYNPLSNNNLAAAEIHFGFLLKQEIVRRFNLLSLT